MSFSWGRKSDGGRLGPAIVVTSMLLGLSVMWVGFDHAADRREDAMTVARLRSTLISMTYDGIFGDNIAIGALDVEDINGIEVSEGLISIGVYDKEGQWFAGDEVAVLLSTPMPEAMVTATKTTVFVSIPKGDVIMAFEWDQDAMLRQSWTIERYIVVFLVSVLALVFGRSVWRSRAARHTKQLRQRMNRFIATGEREPQVQIDHMSSDLARLYSAFDEMAQSSVADVQKAQQSTAERSVLIREVHHRVKNNLQMMSSILSMHIRDTQNPEMIAVMRRIQERVISLATVHTDLYQSNIAGAIPVAPLLNEIADRTEQVANAMGQVLCVGRQIAPVNLLPDQVVPLSLLTAEALNIILNDVMPTGLTPDAVSLTFQAETECVLSVEIKGKNLKTMRRGNVGRQLMQAFATQLNATFSEASDDDYLRLTFTFAPVD